VTSGDSWLYIQPETSVGTNSGIIDCWFSLNTGTARTGIITVTAADGASGSPMNVMVTQAGTIVLSVSPTNRKVTIDAGTTTFSVSNTGAGTMPWTAAVTSGDSWLSITSGASGSKAGTINCSFTANTGTTARTGTVRITVTGATSLVDVTVTQAATPSTQTGCMATVYANGISVLLQVPYLTYSDPGSGTVSLWADFLYEFNSTNTTSVPFKLTNYDILKNPSFSCAASTLSGNLIIHIPDILFPDNTHYWVDLEYSKDLSINGNIYFLYKDSMLIPQ
jgi:hypothetical protein